MTSLRRSLGLATLALLLTTGSALNAQPKLRAQPKAGDTCWRGGYAFEFLGPDADGRERWLFPHLDGVPEVFVAHSAQLWLGSLASRFLPAERRFERRFNAVEAANELAASATSTADRRRAARLLALFVALHPEPAGPSYLEPMRKRIERRLEPDAAAWVKARAAELQALLATARGTSILRAPAQLVSSRDHYRALIADGYLDVVAVAGNSLDKDTGERYGGRLLDGLRRNLVGLGFRARAERGAEARTLYERSAQLEGQRVVVRLRVAGGSKLSSEVRRAVGAFVDGMARADVVLYVGHSNKNSGAYYLSEGKTPFSRFKLGKDAPDLSERFHGLGQRRHQVFALQSCSSYPKYCVPIRAHYEGSDELAAPGFLGTPDVSYFQEFVPRTTAFLEHLLRGAGPREIARALNAIKPRPKSPPLVLRGVLQPRHAFVVPPKVTLSDLRELGAAQGYLAVARGSDGEDYVDSAVFPQDTPGQIVQVVRWRTGAFGLDRSGELSWVGADSQGSALVPPALRRLRLIHLARVSTRRKGRERLLGLDAQHRVIVIAGDRSGARLAKHQPPKGARLVALGERAGRLVARDAQGRGYAWSPKRGWTPRAEAKVGGAPSLLVGGRVVRAVAAD